MATSLRQPAPVDPGVIVDNTPKPPAPLRNVDPQVLAKKERIKSHITKKVLKKKSLEANPDKLKLGHR